MKPNTPKFERVKVDDLSSEQKSQYDTLDQGGLDNSVVGQDYYNVRETALAARGQEADKSMPESIDSADKATRLMAEILGHIRPPQNFTSARVPESETSMSASESEASGDTAAQLLVETNTESGLPEDLAPAQIPGQETEVKFESEEAEALYLLRKENVYATYRIFARNTKNIRRYNGARNQLLSFIADRASYPHPTSKERAYLDTLDDVIGEAEAKLEAVTKDPDGYYAVHYAQLKKYRQALDSGRLVETPSVAESAKEVLQNLERGQPVFIHGDLGSGKTELAYHVSRTYLGKEPRIISGRKDISEYEMFAHNVLQVSGQVDEKVSEQHRRDFILKLEKELKEWDDSHEAPEPGERERAYESLRAALVVELQGLYSKQTYSDIHLGAIYAAMEAGVPVIIDEANSIPHEMLIGLNHLLTRRVGDEVEVQQDSGKKITIAPGFGFIFTGNINIKDERYVGRQDLDPAFLSRIHVVHHDYPPQASDVAFSKLEESHNEMRETEGMSGVQHELFDIMVAMLTDGVGRLSIPKDSLPAVWELAKVAKVFQDNFSRQQQGTQFYPTNGNAPVPYQLKKSVLSIRGLKVIIEAWKADNFKNPLGYYLWHNFINQATVPQDKAFMYAYVKQNGGLIEGNGFTEAGSPFDDKGAFSGNFSVSYTANKTKLERETLTPRQIIDVLHGHGPERTEYPKLSGTGELDPAEAEEQAQEEQFRDMNEYLTNQGLNLVKFSQFFAKRCPATS